MPHLRERTGEVGEQVTPADKARRETPEYRAAQVVRVQEWRKRHPGYRSVMSRVERFRLSDHTCPGNGRPCMTIIPGYRLFCSFCSRGPG